MINVSTIKMGKHFGDSYIRYDGEIIDSDSEYEEELAEYEMSILEMCDGIWKSFGIMVMEPTETSKFHVSSHQQLKTIKKTNKKKSMEQRARQKKSNRIDTIVDYDD